MKKTALLCLALLMGGAIQAQDMTSYITNPSFETNSTDGWDVDGFWTQSNTAFTLKVGTVYCEKWTGKGGYVGDASIYQTLKDLPNGTYTLTAVMQNIQEDTPATKQKGVYLVGGNNRTAVTVAGTYSVQFSTISGQPAIGVLISGCTGNYVCVDNFQLTYDTLDMDSCHALLQGYIDQANALNKHVTGYAAQTELDEATSAASALLTATTDEGLRQVVTRLLAAIDNYPYGIASEENPCLMTDFVTNPDFEDGLTGWTNDGMGSQGNLLFEGTSGTIYCEKWTWAGNQIDDGGISQRVTNLPNGRYRLVAAAQNKLQKDGASDDQKGAYVFADDMQTEVHASADYTVLCTVVEKQLNIGFRFEKATGNWMSCDNFRLYYLGYDAEAIQAELNRRVAQADSLAQLDMDPQVLATLKQATETARQATVEDCAQAAIALREASEAAQESIDIYAFADKIAHGTGTAPKVTTGTDQIGDFVARGSTIILGRATITGSNIIEQGYCYSTINEEPTVLDNRSTESFSYNGTLYRISDLNPATIYYVRPYAITATYAVGYGQTKKVITLPKGTCGYSYNFGADAAANDRINSALADGIWYFNNCTEIHDFWVSCSYGSGTPTADCSYGGSMRVGPNSSYQRTGTIQHEMCHGVGVGTISRWWDTTLHDGAWKGERGNRMAQFFDNNSATTMKGDSQHMWPYGINGASEDTGSPVLYMANAMIVQALHEDGLTATWSSGNASPAWTFENVEDEKYYIKNEGYGTSTGYLTETSAGVLTLTDITGAEVVQDDAFAWNIHFDPATQMYQLRNVKSGKYITYSGSSFRTVTRTTPTSAENIQMMNSRGEVTLKNGNHQYTNHSYWLFTPENSQSPHTLGAAASGTVNTVSFNLTDAATAQRWFLLPANEVEMISQTTEAILNQELIDMIASAKAVLATPHVSVNDSVDIRLSEAISVAEEQVETLTKYADIQSATATLRAATIEMVGQSSVESEDAPYDITFELTNADIHSNEGWSTDFTYSYSCGEFYETTFELSQSTVDKLPKGDYRFLGQAFQRPGSADDEATATNKTTSTLFARTKTQRIHNIVDGGQTTSQGGNERTLSGLYIPNNMATARTYFDLGLYQNQVDFSMTASVAAKMGLKCVVTADTYYWVCFDNFRLQSFGNSTLTGVETVTDAAPQTAEYFSLDGKRLGSTPTRGIYLERRGSKVTKRIVR